MTAEADHLYQDFDYIQGQISALRALILGLAQNVPKETFRDQALQRLEVARNQLLYSEHSGSDARRQAIDDCEEWVNTLTE